MFLLKTRSRRNEEPQLLSVKNSTASFNKPVGMNRFNKVTYQWRQSGLKIAMGKGITSLDHHGQRPS
jgi:hypothetical protein